jgi:hypothetical protein
MHLAQKTPPHKPQNIFSVFFLKEYLSWRKYAEWSWVNYPLIGQTGTRLGSTSSTHEGSLFVFSLNSCMKLLVSFTTGLLFNSNATYIPKQYNSSELSYHSKAILCFWVGCSGGQSVLHSLFSERIGQVKERSDCLGFVCSLFLFARCCSSHQFSNLLYQERQLWGHWGLAFPAILVWRQKLCSRFSKLRLHETFQVPLLEVNLATCRYRIDLQWKLHQWKGCSN